MASLLRISYSTGQNIISILTGIGLKPDTDSKGRLKDNTFRRPLT